MNENIRHTYKGQRFNYSISVSMLCVLITKRYGASGEITNAHIIYNHQSSVGISPGARKPNTVVAWYIDRYTHSHLISNSPNVSMFNQAVLWMPWCLAGPKSQQSLTIPYSYPLTSVCESGLVFLNA